jgi:hypothetical protein
MNDLQNITHKTKDRITRTPLKIGEGKQVRDVILIILTRLTLLTWEFCVHIIIP